MPLPHSLKPKNKKMKKKKKLSLNKATVSKLDSKAVYGGANSLNRCDVSILIECYVTVVCPSEECQTDECPTVETCGCPLTG